METIRLSDCIEKKGFREKGQCTCGVNAGCNICGGKKQVIEGVSPDAEIVTNANGGKQSKSPAALHLVDPSFLNNRIWCYDDNPLRKAVQHIATYMGSNCLEALYSALDSLEKDRLQQLLTIGKVLQYGAKRYAPNNWRLIPREEHINHALIHLIAALAGDTQDDHIDHAMCRLMMAIATTETEGFSYTKP